MKDNLSFDDLAGEKKMVFWPGDFDLSYFFENSSFFVDDRDNDTCCTTGDVCNFSEEKHFEAGFIPVLYYLALVLGLLGNGMVLGVLAKRRRSWSVTDTFILHLAVADSMLVLTLPLWAAQAADEWSFGTALCKISGALFTINFYCGIFLLACISLDRYLSIVHAVQMYSRRNPCWVQSSCLSVWLLSLLLSVPDWVFLQAVRDDRREVTECVHNYLLFSRSASDWRLASRVLHIVAGFLLPSAVLLFCYSSILLRLRRGSQGPQKRRAVRVVLALVVGFFLCWTPYNVTLLVDSSEKKPEEELADGICENGRTALASALTVAAALGSAHASLRPPLYLWLCGRFRRRAAGTLRCEAAAEADDQRSLWGLSLGEPQDGDEASTARQRQETVMLDERTAVGKEKEVEQANGKANAE